MGYPTMIHLRTFSENPEHQPGQSTYAPRLYAWRLSQSVSLTSWRTDTPSRLCMRVAAMSDHGEMTMCRCCCLTRWNARSSISFISSLFRLLMYLWKKKDTAGFKIQTEQKQTDVSLSYYCHVVQHCTEYLMQTRGTVRCI